MLDRITRATLVLANVRPNRSRIWSWACHAFVDFGLRPSRQARGLVWRPARTLIRVCPRHGSSEQRALRSSSYGERHLTPSAAVILRIGKRISEPSRAITDYRPAACEPVWKWSVRRASKWRRWPQCPASTMIKAVERTVRI